MQTTDSNKLFQQALAHHQAGRLAAARAAYHELLSVQPNHPDVLHMLGVLNAQQGRPDAAVELIRRAIQFKPHYPEALINLALALTALGRIDEAIDVYKRAVQAQPGDPMAHYQLAEALIRTARFEEARAAYERAVQLKPDFVPAISGLGMALGELDRFDEAQLALDRAIALSPNDPLTHEAKGLVLLRVPTRMTEAADCLRTAVTLAPNLATAWNGLGGALRALGQFDEASDCFRRAVDLRPDFAVFAKNLTSTSKQTASVVEADIARLNALLKRPDASLPDRAAAGFALGKILDDANRFDEAFGYFAAANELVKQERAARGERFDAEALNRQIDEITGTFTPAFFAEHQDWGDRSELPVFIVGMPRSGTTLVEQIAASHPAVIGAGELKDIDQISVTMGRNAAAWKQPATASAAAAHLDRLRAIGRGSTRGGNPGAAVQRVIDKMMGNVVELGLIATLFPAARVIICRRDPRDNCLSCYFQQFSTGNLFTYDLADCGRRYLQVERLLEHWQRALPLAMLSVQYEDLVADLPGRSRRLIDFLGLPWDPACLEFHRAQRAVITASSWQVRQPIYNYAVGRWRHYERYLQPLLNVLAASASARTDRSST